MTLVTFTDHPESLTLAPPRERWRPIWVRCWHCDERGCRWCEWRGGREGLEQIVYETGKRGMMITHVWIHTVTDAVLCTVFRNGGGERHYWANFWGDKPRAARRMRRFLRMQSEVLRRAVKSEE